MRVMDLTPGDKLRDMLSEAVFIGRIYPHPEPRCAAANCALVIWRMTAGYHAGEYMFDALMLHQELPGEFVSNTPENLREALGIKWV